MIPSAIKEPNYDYECEMETLSSRRAPCSGGRRRGGSDGAGAARAGTATVSGLVFEDKDGSGKPSPGNSGFAGVLVSNGKDIAVTDADGRYTLPLPEEAVIFVIKPAGFIRRSIPRPTCRASIAYINPTDRPPR